MRGSLLCQWRRVGCEQRESERETGRDDTEFSFIFPPPSGLAFHSCKVHAGNSRWSDWERVTMEIFEIGELFAHGIFFCTNFTVTARKSLEKDFSKMKIIFNYHYSTFTFSARFYFSFHRLRPVQIIELQWIMFVRRMFQVLMDL